MKLVAGLFLALIAGTLGRKQSRIIGGTRSQLHQFPHQVIIRLNGLHQCGGSIISERHILTAAHCFPSALKPPYRNVTVVTDTIAIFDSKHQVHPVANVTKHPFYLFNKANHSAHDIAIVTLQKNLTLSERIQKLKLPSRSAQLGDAVIAAGWGRTSISGKKSTEQHYTNLEIIPWDKCENLLNGNGRRRSRHVFSTEICAFSRKKQVGMCYGDSGGGLFKDDEIIGVTSWVVPCALGLPDVFGDVFRFVDWIKRVMNENKGNR
ncbi:chymotrypsin-2-like [Trichogramma pretiosum]|uniref:chymotrypsin-2-like n=1 Tax=Trichogramma pretiosum TaxID=7493 RepID=UPI0006C95051|nr:chymotrypsin-2-like [Trichogramma pretiosum]